MIFGSTALCAVLLPKRTGAVSALSSLCFGNLYFWLPFAFPDSIEINPHFLTAVRNCVIPITERLS